MTYRSLGRTGWQISEIGFGTWGMGGGWGALDDAEAKRALHRFLDLGGNFIDTAYGYGDGHSEVLIGEVLKERKEPNQEIFIASKVPPKTMQWPLRPNVPVSESYPTDWVISCTERTLKNLGVETLDLQQLHAWTDEYNEQTEWYEALSKFKEQGKIRAIGVSINDYVPESGVRLAKSGRVDAIQVIYNLFEQDARTRTLCGGNGERSRDSAALSIRGRGVDRSDHAANPIRLDRLAQRILQAGASGRNRPPCRAAESVSERGNADTRVARPAVLFASPGGFECASRHETHQKSRIEPDCPRRSPVRRND